MILQNEILPFEPIYGIPMLMLWIVTFLFGIMLLDAKLMTKKVRFGIYLLILFCGGIFLGGIPNAVMPIQQLLISLGSRGDLGYLLPALIILFVLILTSLLTGRIFCGYACALGNFQELISNFNFKSDLNAQKKARYRIDVPSKLTTKIRWVFFGAIFFLAIVWSIVFLPEVNPLSGFEEFRRFFAFTITFPFIGLIVVGIASVFIYRPWCRFLCPFGAVSCFCSNFAPTVYIRTEDCTECELCEKVCPTQEAFSESKKGECYYCNRCVEICPEDAIILNLD
ncbi:MAG: 4Fe-4S binding protein [Candidatus Hodarchaeales archaeon]|jgi:polyferredoxin